MKQLVILRGAPGSGKSTFIKERKLTPYTVSPDELRSLYGSPVLTEVDGFQVSNKNEKRVWNMLSQLIEYRMKEGDFVVVDATHTRARDFKVYKDLADKYRYRVYCVDFGDTPLETLKEQNQKRDAYKIVPDQVIEDMYQRLQSSEIPSWVVKVKPENFEKEVFLKPIDFSMYKKIHHFGDIHGCATVLKEYLKDGFKEDECYIFLGDYVDRGIENAEVLNFLFLHMDRKNVIFLEGNHERHLWNWANNAKANSREFENVTRRELEGKGVSRKDARRFYRKLRQCAHYIYGEKEVLVTHGGLTNIPSPLSFVSTEQLIRGVGDYSTEVDRLFTQHTNETQYQLHGHRNIQNYPTQVTHRSFNLEGKIEQGGMLRIVTLDEKEFKVIEMKNDVFDERFVVKEINVDTDNRTFLEILRANKFIVEKKQEDNISSFNFDRKVFYDALWDNQTVKARGLFIHAETTEIVARSYDKFFNIGEMQSSSMESLKKNLIFPVKAYLKENGFLGITGYNTQRDHVVIASKSTTTGRFKEMFEDILTNTVPKESIEKMKEHMKIYNTSFIFEVVDPKNDPHMVEYDQAKIVLLDIVYRTPEFSKLSYEEMVKVAKDFGLAYKELSHEFQNWDEFETWYKQAMNDFSLEVEGYVIEDNDGFMTKVKLPFYSFWKGMRTARDRVAKGKEVKKEYLEHPLAKAFYEWMEKQEDKTKLGETDIITLRKAFEKETIKQ